MKINNISKDRRIALFSGILILLGIIVGVFSIVPAVESPNYLTEASENQNQVLMGALFQFILIPIYLGFALLLYPIVSKYSESLAIGFVGFRIIAQVFQLIGVIFMPLFVFLSQEYVTAATTDRLYIQTFGELLRLGRDLVNHVGVMSSTGLGNLILYYIFYKTKLIPRWLSVFGFVGNILGIVASFLILFSIISVISREFIALSAPLVLQEVILAFWLIIKGFRLSESNLTSKPMRNTD
ncbi:DUF4386 domain-containing protein [Haladaptatus sp. T7]|uniref:DUF4386 domain-containing protein n=1 Tax=Haladaptatus sp. T7 TaxID=2029368 RepID=UPI0021A255E0|nr:DUF4386 domain-containing protein [Haladaptatus sp. T7]GKZ14595.1 hypothetical protein HAL_24760 [Haladaptatus sp. T7]